LTLFGYKRNSKLFSFTISNGCYVTKHVLESMNYLTKGVPLHIFIREMRHHYNSLQFTDIIG